MAANVAYGSLPFREQIAFFQRKLDTKTDAWTDVYGAEHDNEFMVAGANRDDVLADFRQAIERAITEGARWPISVRTFPASLRVMAGATKAALSGGLGSSMKPTSGHRIWLADISN